MIELCANWLKRYFSEPETVVLMLVIAAGVLVVSYMGRMLAPVLASIIIAYLLASLVNRLEKLRVPHTLAVAIVYLGFLALLLVSTLGLLPLLWQQMSNLYNELPNMLSKGQTMLMHLPERYPEFISQAQLQNLLLEFKGGLAKYGQMALSFSLASIPSLIAFVVYFILVPMLVYFFLKDRRQITQWLASYLPQQRRLLAQVWREVDEQIGNYVRGKVIEVLLVSFTCYIVFALMHLQYAMLLAVAVGLSVIIPYIGAVVVTIPVVIIAFVQWGWSSQFGYLMLAYAIINIIDGNVLVPLLFAEAVNLHPVAIIVAVLFFGGIWGFWGIFFAIPLASLVKAVLNAWNQNTKVS